MLIQKRKMDLLGEDSDSDIKLTINKNYAERYDKWRQGEELQKLKDKYGEDFEEDSTSSEDEDDGARELTEDIEKKFFKTLSCLKEKNPKIYDQNVKFFENKLPEKSEKEKKKKDDFFSVGEYQRKILLEKGGKLSDDEESFHTFKELTNAEQEKALKESFKNVLENSDSESEENGKNWGGLFRKRNKTEQELQSEEENYRLWLAGEKEKLKDKKQEEELKGLKDFWSNPQLDENEQFLKDYILNKRFLEKDDKQRIPTYDEVVHDSDSGLSGDESTLQQQEEFERKYNFRFEEPDQEFIKRYPRTLEYSMRKKDERRKKHRQEVKTKKKAEKAKKAEELKRLKYLKRKEIMEKIQKLREITGNDDLGFQRDDVEGDFDPEEHDKRMSELFNEGYYGACEDEGKPEFPELDEELEIENWDNWDDERGKGGEEEEGNFESHCEDPDFNMDCDYDPNARKQLQKELVESTKKRKKRRQSKLAAAVAKEKPVFDPKDKSFEEYIDEYYSLDYEDLIGDLPCRFKYRKVVPNDFGLTVEEILAAPDKELNSWVSVKRIMQRRPEFKELYDVKAYKRKANDFEKKRKCLPSIYGTPQEDPLSAEMMSQTQHIEKLKKSPDNKHESKSRSENLKRQSYEKEDNVPSKKKKRLINQLQSLNENSDLKEINAETQSECKKFGSGEETESREGSVKLLSLQNGVNSQKRKKKKKETQNLENSSSESIKKIKGIDKNSKNSSFHNSSSINDNGINNNKSKNKKKYKIDGKFGQKNKNKSEEKLYNISDSRLKSYGLNPKKLKNKLKYKGKI